MVFQKVFLIFLAAYCIISNEVNGQDCVPSVKSVTISSNATLWWEVDSDECEITSFKVDIEGDQEDEYHFTVTETFIDLPFLSICERWRFTVTPFSNDVEGYPHVMSSYVPLPPEADLTLSYFTFNVTGNSVVLEWDLMNQTHGDCSLEYRLTLEDFDRGTMDDVYVQGKSAVIDVASPCISYGLNLRAINQAHPTIEGPMKRLFLLLNPRVQQVPILTAVETTPTSINTTWRLEGDTNRCPLRYFHIDADGNFWMTKTFLGNEDATTASLRVNYVKPNTMYYMTAFVENSGGRSPPARIAVQTPDLSPS